MTITFDHVSFQYDKQRKVLDDFNLTIPAGQKVALVGINGAGKTTLVKLLCGLYRPDSGRILLNGRELTEDNREDRKSTRLNSSHLKLSRMPSSA